tara:strand:+ start:10974 stop:11408 length:435 start_codon:yes stop_codon:yes gene_type:complete
MSREGEFVLDLIRDMITDSGYSISEDDSFHAVTGDDWSADQVGEKTGDFYHSMFYVSKYNDAWDHYLNLWVHTSTLKIYVLHQFWSNVSECGPRYLDSLKLFEDSLYNDGSIEKTVEFLKNIKNRLIVGSAPDDDRITTNSRNF